MPYLSRDEVLKMGFKSVGREVKISSSASIYDCERISLGDFCRIDDFCVISGNINFGNYIHITPMCLFAGGEPGIDVDDFCTFAYGSKVFSQSDDYSGQTMCGSLVPRKYKKEIFSKIKIGAQVIVGASSIILPGAHIAEGCSIGAGSLVLKPTTPWGIYYGVPAVRKKERSRGLKDLEIQFLRSMKNDSI